MTDPDDLDAMVTELNAGRRGRRWAGDTVRLRGWLAAGGRAIGQRLLLVAGAPPSVRVTGAVVPLAEGPLGGDEIADAVIPALPPHADGVS